MTNHDRKKVPTYSTDPACTNNDKQHQLVDGYHSLRFYNPLDVRENIQSFSQMASNPRSLDPPRFRLNFMRQRMLGVIPQSDEHR